MRWIMRIKLVLFIWLIPFLFFSVISVKSHASNAHSQVGLASWYGSKLHGGKTASGERFDMNGYTAAHRSLPIGAMVRVINLKNGKDVVVRINDRGPFNSRRIIDLSRAAAKAIGLITSGVAKVKLEVISAHRAKSYTF
jgi:rare lipoprotein A